jgi:hypothetical protein
VSGLTAQKLARLKAIMAERAAWADQVAQIKRMHSWVLEVDHLLDLSPRHFLRQGRDGRKTYPFGTRR